MRVIEREGEDQNRAGNYQRGWKLVPGAFLAMLRPVAGGPRNRRNYLYSDFCAERDKFLSCKCDAPSRSRGGCGKGVRGARREGEI